MIDVIARSQRLLGKEVFFPWGVDRNGINIEFTVEKNTGRKMKTYDRAEFLKLCEETIEEYTQSMRKTASRVGLSCDFEKEYLTDAPDYRAVTQAIFVDLFKRGEIVEDLRPNIYDPVEGTTIADAEVERLQRETQLIDVRWNTDNGEELIISTNSSVPAAWSWFTPMIPDTAISSVKMPFYQSPFLDVQHKLRFGLILR